MSPPKAREEDTYGMHACKFMLRMAEVGVDAAIQAEIDSPSWQHPQWCAMVIDLAAHRAER